MIEGRQITESQIKRDASNRRFGVAQRGCGRAEAAAQHVLVRRHAARMTEGSQKMVLAHGDMRGHFAKAQVTP